MNQKFTIFTNTFNELNDDEITEKLIKIFIDYYTDDIETLKIHISLLVNYPGLAYLIAWAKDGFGLAPKK
jgi:hypothetical protein